MTDRVQASRKRKTLEAKHSELLIIDLQERLMPAIFAAEEITSNVGKLIRAAEILGVPIVIVNAYTARTEQP